jgi:hypothetical protein
MGGLNADWKAAVWAKDRNMWCTAPFIHAAGRNVYRVGEGGWQALTADEARDRGFADSAIEDVFTFQLTGIEVEDDRTLARIEPTADSTVRVFRVTDQERYAPAMASCLANLLEGLGEP